MQMKSDGAEIDDAVGMQVYIEAYKRNLKNVEKAYHLLSLHHNSLLLQNMELRSHRAKSCWWCRLKYTVANFRGKEG